MRLRNYINELSSIYGKGITFVDIDESIFRTFAKVYVVNDVSGKIIKKLTNQEFNTYKLKDGESFDFHEFRDAELFAKTSIPIPKTIDRIKRMFKNIEERGSKVIFLTARADFKEKEKFLQVFKNVGIPINDIYIERVGNFHENPEVYKNIIKNKGMSKSVSDAKKKVILEYISNGEYRRVRLIDDDKKNIKDFLSIEKSIPKDIIEKIKRNHNITNDESIPVIEFFGLLVQSNGSLIRIK